MIEIVCLNIEDLLRRGETLDYLKNKSNDLNTVSIEDIKPRKKANWRCFNIYRPI